MTSVATQRPRSGAPRDPASVPAPSRPRFRRLPATRPLAADVALAVVALGFGATIGITLTVETSSQLSAPAGIEMFLGNLTGLAGTYLALVMVLLVSRVPVVERVLGQDGLLRWHRKLAPWPISLIVLHAIFLTYAYAVVSKSGLLHQIGSFISSYSGMAIAIIGFVIMVLIGVLSIHSIRRRLRRETWWALHLGMYLAFALAFLHEVVLGPSFVGHPLTVAVWSAAWAATAGLVIFFRFGVPIFRSLRHDLRVAEVRREAQGVTSVVLRGRHLERLPVAGGQFVEWRFLAPRLWWQAHPYSLSALPQPPYLRLTVKAVGDHSNAVSNLKPGTRVAFEGPYGAFTTQHLKRRKVALVAGGIGVTAARSLLEDLPKGSDPIVILRASTKEEVALEKEVRELAARLNGKVHVVIGSRSQVPLHKVVAMVPDVKRREFYVSGSESFVDGVVLTLKRRGVPGDAIHHDVYAL